MPAGKPVAQEGAIKKQGGRDLRIVLVARCMGDR